MAFNFDEELDRRNTDSIKWDTHPEDTIPMFIADMDFAVSPAITRAIKQRAEHPVFGYTRSNKRLTDAFLTWFQENYRYELKPEWLVLIPGIVPALAVASKVCSGDSITSVPNYSMLLRSPAKAGKKLYQVPLKNTEEYYELDFDELQKNLTKDTDIFYLCSPHNPVGRVFTREELKQVSEFAEKNQLVVVSDEIHCELVYDRAHTPFLMIDDYAREHSITFMAPGKTYNIPGVVLAFAIIPNAELRKRFQTEWYTLSGPGIFNMEAAIAAYSESTQWKRELVDYLRENRNYLEHELRRRFPKARLTHTEGTYLQWVDFRAYGADKTAEFFRRKAKVAFSSGEEFGGPGYVRINFGCRRAVLKAALDRIGQALEAESACGKG